MTLIRSYPDLIWKVDEEDHSIFHIAIMNRHEEIFKLIHELGAIKDLIAVDKEANSGNNMLHLAGSLPPLERLNCVSGAALQMQRELLWFEVPTVHLSTLCNINSDSLVKVTLVVLDVCNVGSRACRELRIC